jgi:hypothetical protein
MFPYGPPNEDVRNDLTIKDILDSNRQPSQAGTAENQALWARIRQLEETVAELKSKK